MKIELEFHPELTNQIISCKSKGANRDAIKDDCCNTCFHSERIYSADNLPVPVGLYCPLKKRVVDCRYKCVNFQLDTLLPCDIKHSH